MRAPVARRPLLGPSGPLSLALADRLIPGFRHHSAGGDPLTQIGHARSREPGPIASPDEHAHPRRAVMDRVPTRFPVRQHHPVQPFEGPRGSVGGMRAATPTPLHPHGPRSVYGPLSESSHRTRRTRTVPRIPRGDHRRRISRHHLDLTLDRPALPPTVYDVVTQPNRPARAPAHVTGHGWRSMARIRSRSSGVAGRTLINTPAPSPSRQNRLKLPSVPTTSESSRIRPA